MMIDWRKSWHQSHEGRILVAIVNQIVAWSVQSLLENSCRTHVLRPRSGKSQLTFDSSRSARRSSQHLDARNKSFPRASIMMRAKSSWEL